MNPALYVADMFSRLQDEKLDHAVQFAGGELEGLFVLPTQASAATDDEIDVLVGWFLPGDGTESVGSRTVELKIEDLPSGASYEITRYELNESTMPYVSGCRTISDYAVVSDMYVGSSTRSSSGHVSYELELDLYSTVLIEIRRQ